MAEAILIEVAKTLVISLGCYAKDQLLLAWRLNKEVEKLKRTMKRINAVLKDQSEATRQKNNHADEDWLNNLRDALYDLDDIFDEMLIKAERKKLMDGNAFGREVKLFFSSSNQLYNTCMLVQRIKSIGEFIDSMSKNQSDIKPPSEAEGMAAGREGKRTLDDVVENIYEAYRTDNVVGRENEIREIISMLLPDSSLVDDHDDPVSVIPIVGGGGLGKTTLARHVFNEEIVKDNFDLRVWVSVPREVNLKELMEKIASATGGSGSGDYDELKLHLSKCINGKKYLLVLDNVWKENAVMWQELKSMLTVGAALGSKIIVTTRSLIVGNIMSTVQSSYNLKPLSGEDAWTLFEKIVFRKKGLHESGVEGIGKEIVGMCRNVPLLVRALASVLATVYSVREWSAFKKDKFINLGSYGEEFDVMQILRLSYDHLKPANLRSCFSYCSLFPREFVFEKARLVSLWIAQGFVEPQHTGESLEDAGERYLNILVSGGLLQDVEGWKCKLHDLMYDLSCSVAGGQYKVLRSREDTDLESSVIHLSIGYNPAKNWWRTLGGLQSQNRLRTFKLLERPRNYELSMSDCDDLISSFPRLRTLDLSSLGIKELPNSIGKLIHLRYLDLSFNSFKQLPDSITLLYKLQYLDISDCGALVGLPKDMKKLVNLRHLYMGGFDPDVFLPYFPSGFGNLTSLQTLKVFVVPDTKDMKTENHCYGNKADEGGRLSDLGSLNNLKGGMWIIFRGSYQDMALDAKVANLKGKTDLGFLLLYFLDNEDEMLFENLQPPANIPNLSVNKFQGRRLPTWMVTNQLTFSLPHLEYITIHTCYMIQYIPSFARLPKLKNLVLYDLPNVVYLESDVDEYEASSSSSSSSQSYFPTIFFPSLTRLEIGHLHNLKGWGKSREGELSFPCASIVWIYHCYVLESMPPCPNVEHLQAIHVPVPVPVQTSTTAGGTYNPSSSSSGSGSGSKMRKLEVSSAEYLVSLPRDSLQKVSELIFRWGCDPLNMEALGEGIESMTSLKIITFWECIGLTTLSGLPAQLGTLERLYFYLSHWLLDFTEEEEKKDDDEISGRNAWKVLKNLRQLTFDNMKKFEVLPRGIQQITTLQSLELRSLEHLEEIPSWIGNLSSLSRLVIAYCPKLNSFPPEMRNLKKLEQLVVEICPGLADKCKNEDGTQTGEDWPKIQHIPQIIITR